MSRHELHAKNVTSASQRPVFWFAIGVVTATILMWTQAQAVGGLSGLLAVGEDSALTPVIAAEMPDLSVRPGDGNDGQIYFAVALDLDANSLTQFVPQPAIRWRRILLPAVASLGGLIRGPALLWAIAIWTAIGLGLATAATQSIGGQLGVSRWVVLGVLANPGVWLSVRLLTPDVLALGLGLTGIALMVRSRHGMAIVSLILAALTKEPYLLVALGGAAWLWKEQRRRLAIAYAAFPSVITMAWAIVAMAITDNADPAAGNLAAPFVGLIRAAYEWGTVDSRQQVWAGLALAVVAAGALAGIRLRKGPIPWLLWPWIALAVVASEWVWRFGNAAMRAFAPILVFAVLAFGALRAERNEVQET